MTADEFLTALADELGAAPPSEQERATLLKLAAIAAHGSERLAAPLACFLVGRAGADPEAARAAAKRITGHSE